MSSIKLSNTIPGEPPVHGTPFQQTRDTGRSRLTSWGGSLGPSGSTPAPAPGGGLPDRSL